MKPPMDPTDPKALALRSAAMVRPCTRCGAAAGATCHMILDGEVTTVEKYFPHIARYDAISKSVLEALTAK